MDKELMMAVVEAIERVARSNEAVEVQLMEINEKLKRGVSVDISSMPPKER
jgi:predicted RNA-binding protein with RPS1 domain